MRKFFVAVAVVLSVNHAYSNVFAASELESRVAVLEGKVLTLEATVASQQTAIQGLQVTVADLQSRLTTTEDNPAVQIGALGYMRLDTNELNGVVGPNVIFEGVNVHLQNGSGGSYGNGDAQFNPPNGLGNLIVGYTDISGTYRPLEPGDRSGSHNLVIGHGNKFPGISGFVHGWYNKTTGAYSATVAGDCNIADEWNAVVGGHDSVASGPESVVVGGADNKAQGSGSVVVGGRNNTANSGAILGGSGNTTQGSSVVSGGENSFAIGISSTISGGQNNTATGNWSSISGGLERTAVGDHDWAAGSQWENY